MARAALFDGSTYGLEPLGTPASLETLDREALLAHHRRHFRAPDSVVALAGDLDPADAAALAEQAFAGLPGGEPWSPPRPTIRPGTQAATELPKRQAAIAIAFATGAAADDDHPALELLHHHCADMAGPLFTRIREQLGLAYHVSAMRLPGFDAGAMIFFLATAPEQAGLAESALREELERLATEGIPAEQLERCRNNTLASLALAAQSPGSMARMAAIDTILGLGPRHPLDYPELIRAVTPGQLRDAAARCLGGRPAVGRVNCPR
jgi:zinc protease